MSEQKEDLLKGTILEEVSIISRQGDFLDGNHDKLPKEIIIGELTLFEKSLFTLYKKNILKLNDLERDLLDLPKEKIGIHQTVELTRNILKEKIRIVSQLFTFEVRSRLNLWEGVIINVRRGFQIVEVKTKWTKKVQSREAVSTIQKELKVVMPITGHA